MQIRYRPRRRSSAVRRGHLRIDQAGPDWAEPGLDHSITCTSVYAIHSCERNCTCISIDARKVTDWLVGWLGD